MVAVTLNPSRVGARRFYVWMAGGCTLGQGITGNSSLQLGSFTATPAFFATAVIVSFLFKVLL